MSRAAATLLLLGAAFFWGAGNVASKTMAEHVGPLSGVGLRCLVALAVIAPFALREMRRRPGWRGHASAVCLSSLLVAAMGFQQAAFVWTSVTNVSFLVNVCVVLTPLIAWLVLRERPSIRIAAAAAISLGGAFLMTGGSVSLAEMNRGDLACLVSALFYAGWIVAVGRHAMRYGQPFTTSMVQFAVTALVMIPSGLVIEGSMAEGVAMAWREILILGLFSTGAAFAMQTFAQQYVTSSTAAVLVSAESLFGAAAAFLLLGERTAATGLIGAALILGGILIAATGGPRTLPSEAGSVRSAKVLPSGPDPVVEFRSIRPARTGGTVVPLVPRRPSDPAVGVQYGAGRPPEPLAQERLREVEMTLR